jgi:hypothetical protein
VNELVVQLTDTLLTAAPATVPPPFVILHDWVGEEGDVLTATAYVEPLATAVANVNVVFALIFSGAPPFNVSETESPVASPETEPPIEYVFVLHAIPTFDTGPLPIVPDALEGVHVCHGDVGWVPTVTA